VATCSRSPRGALSSRHTPRCRRLRPRGSRVSVRTWSRNLAPTPLLPTQSPRMSRSPPTVTPMAVYTERFVTCPTLGLDHHRVDEDHQIDATQWTVLPVAHLSKDLVSDRRDRVLGHVCTAHLRHMGRHLTRRQPLRGERDHHLIDTRQAPLPFLDDLRLEGAVPVTRHLDVNRSHIGGTVLALVPFREFPLLRPAGSCKS